MSRIILAPEDNTDPREKAAVNAMFAAAREEGQADNAAWRERLGQASADQAAWAGIFTTNTTTNGQES